LNVEPLEIVRNSRRRALLTVLRELGGEACLREVIRRIARDEGEFGVTRRLVKNIHVSMLQTHIPKLEKAGLIEYDQTTNTVRLLELPPEFRYYLEVVERKDISWSVYYLLLSMTGLAVSLVLGNILALAIASCFLLAAMIHRTQTYGTVNDPLTRVKGQLTKYLKSRRDNE